MITFMKLCRLLVLLCFTCSFCVLRTHQQLLSSQKQVLLQLRKQLEYPKELEFWANSTTDFCYSSSAQVNITCQNNFVTEIRIEGDKSDKARHFNGFAIRDQTLSGNFSMDSLVATLARLNSLKVLSLVSLGIWGLLPDKIHRFYALEYLDLSSNFLFGTIPSTVPRLVMLQTIILDGNYFNGTFPNWSGSNLTSLSMINNDISGKLPDLSTLANLETMNLSNNKFDSELPRLPKSLIMVSLSNNSFSGEIPKQYSQLLQLQKLDLSRNSIQGTPAAALFSLRNITYLNFASNMLSGSFPSHLSCGSELNFVDISNNKLTGRLPSCLVSGPNKKVVKYEGNCLSDNSLHQHPQTYCRVSKDANPEKKKSGRKNIGILAGVIGGICAVLVLLACCCVFLCRRSRETSEQHLLQKREDSVTKFPSAIITSGRFIYEATKLGTQGMPVHRVFTSEELKNATGNFNVSALIGEGCNGKVYKGRLENGTKVAIRCMSVSKKYTVRNLKLRLDLLAKLRHPHLACLLGNCIDDEVAHGSGANKVYLVYEFVPCGNYQAHLSETSEKMLKWSDRLAILIGVAKAVHFLHTGLIPGFFSNRLKTHNVLLNEHQMAKLSDYGLSIVTDETDKPEVKEDPQSRKMKNLDDDVYSFGYIILESIVGPSVSAKKESFMLNDMVSLESPEGQRQVVDPNVLATCSQESLSVAISITSKCISLNSSNRPSFEDILWNLQYAAQIQANADGDHRFETMEQP
ncbi:probable inactive leucine-rich repeat receptor-like protein kinase At3g03770 isoform X2 [Daucus carota subsp. sativus]|uniref:Protein kinase domain-containing protein n=1 Tax=Daucus carota subsp. sativus TaxID=79200 RepID=A0A164UNQ5_DAUCS|nr:PREDICTED: probable inactive leucine-rich repeat receptor-like protein kinase At3g03770 [Daucus carota subsp. sativus]